MYRGGLWQNIGMNSIYWAVFSGEYRKGVKYKGRKVIRMGDFAPLGVCV